MSQISSASFTVLYEQLEHNSLKSTNLVEME